MFLHVQMRNLVLTCSDEEPCAYFLIHLPHDKIKGNKIFFNLNSNDHETDSMKIPSVSGSRDKGRSLSDISGSIPEEGGILQLNLIYSDIFQSGSGIYQLMHHDLSSLTAILDATRGYHEMPERSVSGSRIYGQKSDVPAADVAHCRKKHQQNLRDSAY